MAFGLTIIGSIVATTFILVKKSESNILGNLFFKVKMLLSLTGEVKTIFKSKDINLSVNNF